MMKNLTMLAAATCALALSACASLPAARMVLPEPLAAQAHETLRGLDGWREGSFELGTLKGRYERGADRLSLFGEHFVADRGSAGWVADDGTRARCRSRQKEVSAGILAAALQRYTVSCNFSGTLAGELQLQADSAALSSPASRSGSASIGGQALVLRSMHRVQGSPLTLDAPIGYLIEHDGRAIGAVELNGRTPRVWRPAPGSPLHAPVTQAVLALALLWDPA